MNNIFQSVEFDIQEIKKRYIDHPNPLTQGNYLRELTDNIAGVNKF